MGLTQFADLHYMYNTILIEMPLNLRTIKSYSKELRVLSTTRDPKEPKIVFCRRTIIRSLNGVAMSIAITLESADNRGES